MFALENNVNPKSEFPPMIRPILYTYTICCFLICNIAFAQGENNIWYFGRNVGLDFNNGQPAYVNNGRINTKEGCASACDPNGHLLFYTDGVRVYNRLHTFMHTNLNGSGDASQSAIIVPQPGDSNRYYIFTTDASSAGNFNGLNVSTIDMRLDGGLGRVTIANDPLLRTATEKLTSTLHCNGKDIWVIGADYSSSPGQFVAWLVTDTGISATPIVSPANVSFGILPNLEDCSGTMKISPDGDKLAVARRYHGLDVYNFDNSTGRVSDHNSLRSHTSSINRYYGVEFSPNGKLLYATKMNTIHQFDYLHTNASVVVATVIGRGIAEFGSLQLGPDNRLYISCTGQGGIDVIDNPNNVGTACSYIPDVITWQRTVLQYHQEYGLPQHVPSRIPGNIKPPSVLGNDTTLCLGQNVILNPPFSINATYRWQDGTTTPTYLVQDSGVFWVDIIRGNCTIRDSLVVDIIAIPDTVLGPDSLLCDNESVIVDAAISDANYLWDDGSTAAIRTLHHTKTYWLEIKIEQCSKRDSVEITYFDFSTSILGSDTAICKDSTLELDVSYQGATYLWHDDSTDPIRKVSTPGLYQVDVTHRCGTKSDTINVRQENCACTAYIPNAFTPNQDNLNEGITPVLNCEVNAYSFLVYNRWGQLVFSSKTIGETWNGYSNNTPIPTGIYTYTLSAQSEGKAIYIRGYINAL